MNKLFNKLEEDRIFNDFIKELQRTKKLNVNPFNIELVALLSIYIKEKLNKNILIVTPNSFQMTRIYESISLSEKETYIYPKDEFVATEMLVESKEFKNERANTLKSIVSNPENKIVVTNALGFFSKTTGKDNYLNSIIKINVSDTIDIKELADKLVNIGYTRNYTVEKNGEFSVRGGIVDIFPFTEEKPYRLDFFGDEVDEIKEFNIETQRSEKKVKSIEIYPIFDTLYNQEDIKLIETYINNKLAESPKEEIRQKLEADLENLLDFHEYDQLYKYVPLIYKERNSFSDLLENKIIIYYGYDQIESTLLQNTIQIHEYLTSLKGYLPSIELLSNLENFSNEYSVCFNETQKENNFNFYSEEMFSYENNLDLLIKDILLNINNKYIVISLNTKETKKTLSNILLSYNIEFQDKELRKDQVFLTVDTNAISFNCGGILSITEGLIFNRNKYIKPKYRNIEESKRLKSVNELKAGDYVVHYDYGIGQFVEFTTVTLGKRVNDYIHLKYANDSSLYVPVGSIGLLSKYAGNESFKPRLNNLNGTEWAKTKKRVREKASDLADKLINLYAEREQAVGFSFKPHKELEEELASGFEYEETVDQKNAIDAVLKEMEDIKPMERLVCGDVGFGKTEIAIRAAFRAVLSHKQVVYLAPTTILSRQHYYSFKKRMEQFGVEVALVNRFQGTKEINRVLRGLKEGRIDIVVGTHRLLSNDVVFNDLGLLIIDEEQRFGVAHKEKIKELKNNIDVLTLTATPIPRTLQMAIMGVKNMSIIETAPKNRYPVQTYVTERNDLIIKDAIERELARYGQVFYLYNKVEDIEETARHIQELVPFAKVGIAHGKLDKKEMESVIKSFIDKEYDVLVSTTIIETGIDIPNANTIIIHDADMLGLSQLYQIKGRVGRSNKIAYAYLMYKKDKKMNDEAAKRLKAIKEFTELGSGFKIAIRDLSIRGAGDILGEEQSGFIDSVGVELYLKLLDEEIKKKQNNFKEITPEARTTVDMNKFIDSKYINDDYVKLEMHKKISNITSFEERDLLLEEFVDRFGSVSKELIDYINNTLFESLANEIGVERITSSDYLTTIIFKEETSKRLNGPLLINTSMELSKYFTFGYKTNKFFVYLDTKKETNSSLVLAKYLDKLIKAIDKTK